MKIIITGGRNFNDYEKVKNTLDSLNPSLIVHGDCRGADKLASIYATEKGVRQLKYPYISKYGRAGGPIRNFKMCSENKDAFLVAFPGGNGTDSCVKIAEKLGLKVLKF